MAVIQDAWANPPRGPVTDKVRRDWVDTVAKAQHQRRLAITYGKVLAAWYTQTPAVIESMPIPEPPKGLEEMRVLGVQERYRALYLQRQQNAAGADLTEEVMGQLLGKQEEEEKPKNPVYANKLLSLRDIGDIKPLA
jgi:hypothetical protein